MDPEEDELVRRQLVKSAAHRGCAATRPIGGAAKVIWAALVAAVVPVPVASRLCRGRHCSCVPIKKQAESRSRSLRSPLRERAPAQLCIATVRPRAAAGDDDAAAQRTPEYRTHLRSDACPPAQLASAVTPTGPAIKREYPCVAATAAAAGRATQAVLGQASQHGLRHRGAAQRERKGGARVVAVCLGSCLALPLLG
eukprot:scaffold5277_cov404-Prasinococcus_capsulatus_cf.AAC.8